MGRYWVDSEILRCSHKRKFNVVDLTLLISAHQGMDASGKHKSEVTKDDFLWNFLIINKADMRKGAGRLTSNYFVVCNYLFIILLSKLK